MVKVTRCKACGAEIMFLKTAKGKSMPVDSHSLEFVPDLNGKDLYVLADGNVMRGVPAKETDPDKHIGFVSHFSTCPNGDFFRKPRKKERKEGAK